MIVWYVEHCAGGPGIGNHHRIYHLAREWHRLGVRTHVFCDAAHHLMDAPRTPDSVEDAGVCCYHFLGMPSYVGNGAARLRNMISFGGAFRRYVDTHPLATPDVVIYSSPHPFGAPAANAVARRCGARFALEVRDLWPLTLVEIGGVHRLHPVVLWLARLERRAYRDADLVVSALPHSREHMVERGLDPNRWHYVPNGVCVADTRAAGETSGQREDELVAWVRERQAEGRRVLLYAGALGVPNAVDRLLEAIAALDDSLRARVQLLVVGRGTESERLERLGHALPCRVHEYVSRERALGLMSVCDGGFIGLLPKPIFRFGVSPNKLFDYMVAELPVICAIDAGNDPVGDAHCGWSVRSADLARLVEAITEWLDSSDETLAALGGNGRRWVLEHHDHAQLGPRYLRLLEADVLMNDGSGRAAHARSFRIDTDRQAEEESGGRAEPGAADASREMDRST